MGLSPLPFRVRDRPLLALLLVAVVVAVVGASLAVLLLAGGGPTDDDPGQRLGVVGVQNPLPEPHRVAFAVRRGPAGNRTTVAAGTLRVAGARMPTPDDSGVASGVSVVGSVDANRSWSGPGRYAVRARLADRDRWTTVALGDVEADDDDAGPVPCYDVDALVAPSERGGVVLRTGDCGRP